MKTKINLRNTFCACAFSIIACITVAPLPALGASLEVEGISASIGEDNPRVLYIQPWQTPSLPRRPRADLEGDAPQLIQPLNPLVLERHRAFRQTLNPLVLNPNKDSAVTEQ